MAEAALAGAETALAGMVEGMEEVEMAAGVMAG